MFGYVGDHGSVAGEFAGVFGETGQGGEVDPDVDHASTPATTGTAAHAPAFLVFAVVFAGVCVWGGAGEEVEEHVGP